MSRVTGLLLLLALPSSLAVMQSFGVGRSQISIPAAREFVLLEHTISPQSQYGAITFFWITGDPIGNGPASGVDVALWRFYVDGEAVASVGPLQTAQMALIGNADPSAPWNNDYFGKNAAFGGWHYNLLVPFQKTIKVTLQMPPQFPTQRAFAMVRGVEDFPLRIGSLAIPGHARLVAPVRTTNNLPVLAWHDLINVPATKGVLLAAMIDIASADNGSLNSLEGCWHAYFDGSTTFPGMLLGTGAEDYPESAYYFNAGLFRGPTAGLTVMKPGPVSRMSFYKLHHRDPIVFNNGFRFTWRNGDVTDPTNGEKCNSLTGELIGKPGISNVTTLAYAYVWQ